MLQLKMELTVKEVKELIAEAINTRSSLTISEKDIKFVIVLHPYDKDNQTVIIEIKKEL